MPANNNSNDTIAAALQEISESLTTLVREEIELAKAEVIQKVTGLAAGAAAIAVGAVLGVFALIFVFETLAWGLDGIFANGGTIWLGFLIVVVILLIGTGGAMLFAFRKLKVGAPMPTMAIDEAKKIRQTVAASATSPVITAAEPDTGSTR